MLTVRAHGESVFAHLHRYHECGETRYGPPLVDADSHAFCQTIFQGVKIPEWDAMYCRYKDQAEKNKKSEEKQKINVLWAAKVAKDREVDFNDTSHEKEIKNKSPSKIRQLGQPI